MFLLQGKACYYLKNSTPVKRLTNEDMDMIKGDMQEFRDLALKKGWRKKDEFDYEKEVLTDVKPRRGREA